MFEDPGKEPEEFVCANESRAFVPPSMTGTYETYRRPALDLAAPALAE